MNVLSKEEGPVNLFIIDEIAFNLNLIEHTQTKELKGLLELKGVLQYSIPLIENFKVVDDEHATQVVLECVQVLRLSMRKLEKLLQVKPRSKITAQTEEVRAEIAHELLKFLIFFKEEAE